MTSVPPCPKIMSLPAPPAMTSFPYSVGSVVPASKRTIVRSSSPVGSVTGPPMFGTYVIVPSGFVTAV